MDRGADDGVGLGVGDEGVDTDLTVGREVDLELEGLGQEVGPELGPGAEDEGVIPGRTRWFLKSLILGQYMMCFIGRVSC